MNLKYKPQREYEKKNLIKTYKVPCYKTETEIYNKLEEQKNISGYIKELIREDIKKEGAE